MVATAFKFSRAAISRQRSGLRAQSSEDSISSSLRLCASAVDYVAHGKYPTFNELDIAQPWRHLIQRRDPVWNLRELVRQQSGEILPANRVRKKMDR